MIQKYGLCSTKFYARLMFTSDEESGIVLTASSDILKQLVGVQNYSDVTEIAVPKCKKCSIMGVM